MLSLDDVLAPRPDVITRESEGELVVVIPDRGKFVVLNATGARVMSLADGERPLRAIAVAIADEFGADAARVERDVLNLAVSLVERGVLYTVSGIFDKKDDCARC